MWVMHIRRRNHSYSKRGSRVVTHEKVIWGHPNRFAMGIVMGKLCHREPNIPVLMTSTDVGSEVLMKHAVHTFSETISLRMVLRYEDSRKNYNHIDTIVHM
jgi:hypothetical protein